MQTLKKFKKPLLVQNVSKLLWIFLTATSLSACSGLRKFPTKYVYEVDLKDKVCGQYEITQVRPELAFRYVKDMSLDACNGVYGFSTRDMPDVLDWLDDAGDYAEQKCK